MSWSELDDREMRREAARLFGRLPSRQRTAILAHMRRMAWQRFLGFFGWKSESDPEDEAEVCRPVEDDRG